MKVTLSLNDDKGSESKSSFNRQIDLPLIIDNSGSSENHEEADLIIDDTSDLKRNVVNYDNLLNNNQDNNNNSYNSNNDKICNEAIDVGDEAIQIKRGGGVEVEVGIEDGVLVVENNDIDGGGQCSKRGGIDGGYALLPNPLSQFPVTLFSLPLTTTTPGFLNDTDSSCKEKSSIDINNNDKSINNMDTTSSTTASTTSTTTTSSSSYDPFQLPLTKSSHIIFFIFYIPSFVFSIIYKKRVHELILVNGNRAKSAMLNEISSHILINSLFLTVSFYPIYNKSLPLDHHDIFSTITVGLIYLLFNIQLLTIILYALIIFSMFEIPTAIFNQWLVQRQELIYFTARLDVSGLFIFALCPYVWALSHYDIFYQYICICTSLCVWIIVMYIMGTTITSGPLDTLNPTIKIISKPNSQDIHDQIQRDALLFKPYITQYQLKSINQVLIDLKLSHLIQVFEREYISSMHMIIHLDHDDYRELGITIGERILIQQSQEFQYHKSNHHENSSYQGAFEKYQGPVVTAVDIIERFSKRVPWDDVSKDQNDIRDINSNLNEDNDDDDTHHIDHNIETADR